ncbi:MAG: hypothetical protein M3414_07025, partial [Pseudomonadota bacterium]|nr:hypothetical protein [Pseudomonadota bacterium]
MVEISGAGTVKPYIETPAPLSVRAVWLWVAAYPLVWLALYSSSSMIWFLPAGLRLGVLWILPRHAWWKMAVTEWIVILVLSVHHEAYNSMIALLALTLLPWSIYATVVRSIGRHGRGTPDNKAMPRLLACGALAALLNALA